MNSSNGTCTGTAFGWSCKTSASCGKNMLQKKLVDAFVNYDYITIDNKLISFRDNYLKKIAGGQNVIQYYYQLSENLPLDKIDLSFCKKTFDLIINKIIPLCSKLEENPNLETNILVDNATKTELINYLKEIKEIYNDSNSKSKIDLLIIEIDSMSNKSNDYITKNL
ncbi:hypothetical protein [Flavobacterium sp.]|uniref:hypothetical protein n=1 Tax=Flavobacterium sp. TaxID=239 RepID=UPI003751E161